VGNGDILDIAVHKNVQLSEIIVSDILDLDHLPVIFHLMYPVRSRNLLDPVDKFTDWEQFHSLASQLISPKIQINAGEETDKAVHNYTASIASAYRQAINMKNYTLKIAVPAKQVIPHHWKISKVHACPQFSHGFQPSICI
jgi:hypothetical protein